MNAAHSILLTVLILLCCLIELHPRIRTGPGTSITLGVIAVVALVRLGTQALTSEHAASLIEYIVTGAVLYGILFYLRRINPRHQKPRSRSIDTWRIAP